MYARIARWEGAEADALRRSAAAIRSRAGSGPPPGVPSNGLTLLVDPETGRSMAISFYATEEDMRRGDEALNAMNPDVADVGQRVSVEQYEVAVDVRL